MTESEQIAVAALKEITEIAVEPGTDPMLAVIEMQRIAQGAINKIGGSPDEPPPKPVLRLVKD
jgi:hypothetical protein